MTPAPSLSRKLSINFGSGALGMAIVLNTPAGVLAPFMTNFLGIGAGTVATLLLVSKLYDMVTDPLMGMISDRTKSRWGRRRPYLALGGLIGALGFAMAFNPPEFANQTYLIAYVFGALLVTYTGYTVFNIPYLAMPAEMTESYHERTSLMSYRIAFVNVGGLIAVGAFALVQQLGNDRAAHGQMGLIYGAIILAATVYCFFGTADAKQTKVEQHRYTFKEQVASAFGNRPLLLLLGAKALQLLGVAASAATGVYFKTVILGMSYQMTSVYLFVVTGTIMAAIPFWNLASKKHGKRLIYILCVAGNAIFTLSWLLATADDSMASIMIRGVFLGIFGSGVLVMGPSLLPDTVEYDYLRTGIRREGTVSAFYTTIEKFSFAVGPALTLFLLGVFGYQAGTGGMQTEQPESAIMAIYVGAGLAPALLYAVSILFLLKYDLSEEKLEALRADHAARSKGGELPAT